MRSNSQSIRWGQNIDRAQRIDLQRFWNNASKIYGFVKSCAFEMEDEGDIYESIEDIWPDYPSKDDFFFNEDEY